MSAMCSASAPYNTLARTGAMGLLAALLIWFAVINLFSGFRPTTAANDKLAVALNQSDALPLARKIESYVDLFKQQEALLIQNPIEPYAWMRLSFLRKSVLGDRVGAFDALRFADKIAQPDNVGGMERILMWRDYVDLHTDADRAREVDMWRRSYRENWDNMYNVIEAHHLHHVFDMAIEGDPELLARLNKTRKH